MATGKAEYDLSEYKDLITDGFAASQYANGLLLSTNNLYLSQLNSLNQSVLLNEIENDNSSENELDLVTAMKKISFSIKDVNSKIVKISSSNYDVLINEFEKIESFQKDFNNTLQNSLKELNHFMEILNRDFLMNYESSQKYIRRLKNIHKTYSLINDLILFIDGVKKFNSSFRNIQLDKTYNNIESVSPEELGTLNKNLMKMTNHYYFLNKLLHEDEKLYDSGSQSRNSFKQLKIVKNFNKVYKIEKIDLLNNYCLDLLKNDNFFETTADGEPNSEDYKAKVIVTVIITLMIINNNDSFVEIFHRYYKYELNNCMNLLKKILISPKSFDNSMIKVAKKSDKILKIMRILQNLRLLNYDSSLMKNNPFETCIINDDSNSSYTSIGDKNITRETTTDHTLSLDVFILKNMPVSLNNNSLFTNFYKDISVEFESMISGTLLKGGPVAKNLKNNYSKILASIKKRILENSSDFYKISEKNIEVVMMCNSIKKLNTNK
ncbi:hypothetical protein DASC09_032540 [Saccharomycopsis crataegensis]|uniref:Uncharacterized protein n=1 Tax=Saccharomycopsis crataegensis TaxID=43959 RepID=A0AAV5QMQ9_9ASCO|nr:hypothetical protein DASC09_032540 [Saccharomycopsis crataegensis]